MKATTIQNETGFIVVEVSDSREFMTITIDDFDSSSIMALDKAEALQLAQMIFRVAQNLEQ